MSDITKALLILGGTFVLLTAIENRKELHKYIKKKLNVVSPSGPKVSKVIYILENPIIGREQNVASQQNFYDAEMEE